jgi:hypothetical protein
MSNLAKKSIRFALPFLLVYGCLQSQSYGDLIYIFTGRGSGSLGASPFVDAAFTITARGDESQAFLVDNSNIYRLNSVSAVLEIAGLGAATFDFAPNISVARNELQPANSSIFIGDPNQNRNIFGVGQVASLVNYDLRTPFPLVSGRASNNLAHSFPTINRGLFNIEFANEASFTAVPEPNTSLLLLSLTMLVSFSTRRRRIKLA